MKFLHLANYHKSWCILAFLGCFSKRWLFAVINVLFAVYFFKSAQKGMLFMKTWNLGFYRILSLTDRQTNIWTSIQFFFFQLNEIPPYLFCLHYIQGSAILLIALQRTFFMTLWPSFSRLKWLLVRWSITITIMNCH